MTKDAGKYPEYASGKGSTEARTKENKTGISGLDSDGTKPEPDLDIPGSRKTSGTRKTHPLPDHFDLVLSPTPRVVLDPEKHFKTGRSHALNQGGWSLQNEKHPTSLKGGGVKVFRLGHNRAVVLWCSES